METGEEWIAKLPVRARDLIDSQRRQIEHLKGQLAQHRGEEAFDDIADEISDLQIQPEPYCSPAQSGAGTPADGTFEWVLAAWRKEPTKRFRRQGWVFAADAGHWSDREKTRFAVADLLASDWQAAQEGSDQ